MTDAIHTVEIVNQAPGYMVFDAIDINDTGYLLSDNPVIVQPATNLVAVKGDKKVNLTWTAAAGATSYKVKQSLTAGGPYTTISNVTTATYTDEGLNNGTTYYYVVTAINDIGESDNSNIATAVAGSGTGTEAEPHMVYGINDLKNIINNPSAYYKLANDIDLNNEDWEPIGNYVKPFSGSFDGNGYVISNVKVDKTSYVSVGFFGYIKNGTIRNVTLNNADVTGGNCAGALVGYADVGNAIDNCKVVGTSSVNGAAYIGGLIGYMVDGSVNKCMTNANVTASGGYTGGLVGSIGSTNVSNSYATGNVTSSNIYAGGLIGVIEDAWVTEQKIENCYALGNVTSTSSYAGGLIGRIVSRYEAYIVTVKNSYAAGQVSGISYKGGLIGDVNNASVISCYYDGISSGFIPQSAVDYGRLTTAMKRQANYIDWDFADIWMIEEGNSYPYLKGMDIPEGVQTGLPVNEVAGGIGTAEDPYLIDTKDQLQNVKYEPTANYKLMNDIDLNNEDWEPIGNYVKPFSGSFDGNGYVISNVKVDKTSYVSVGFFGYIKNGTIRNVTLNNADVTGGNCAGALVGYADVGNAIDNCKVVGTSSVNGAAYIGGLIGYMVDGSVNKCMTNANVTASGGYTGGLVGSIGSTNVSNSYATGNVTSSNIYAGGLIGVIEDAWVTEQKIENCYALGNVTSTSSYAGGLIGRIVSRYEAYIVTVKNSYAAGRVSGISYKGGLIGDVNNASVIRCYFNRTTTGINTPSTQARTTNQMKVKTTFVGWDFIDKWDIKETITYPYLFTVAVPMNIQATNITHNQIDLTWNAVEDADGYQVEINGKIIENSATPSFRHINLRPGSIYNYRVRATERGHVSDWSTKVSVVTLLETPINITLAPTAAIITVNWDLVDGAQYYEVYVDGEIINNGNNTTYIHEISNPNTQHIYRIRAKNSITKSTWSDIYSEINWVTDKPGVSVTTNKWITESDVIKETEIVIKAKNINDLYTVQFELEFNTQQIEVVENSLKNLAWGDTESIYYNIKSDSTTGKIKVILSQTGTLEGLDGEFDIASLKTILSSTSASTVKINKIALVNSKGEMIIIPQITDLIIRVIPIN